MSPYSGLSLLPRSEIRRISQALADTLQTAYGALQSDADALALKIAAQIARGEVPSEDWLLRQPAYQRLQAQLAGYLDDLGVQVNQLTTDGVPVVVQSAIETAKDAALIASGAAVTGTQIAIESAFDVIPLDELLQLVISDRNPELQTLLASFGSDGGTNLQRELVSAVARGVSPRDLRKTLADILQITHARALTISRTEILRASRNAQLLSYERSGVVTEWVWHTNVTADSCIACILMHGTVHPFDEPMTTHPNCKCAMVPKTKSWAEINPTLANLPDTRVEIESGEDAFRKLPEKAQKNILTPSVWNLWHNGSASFADLVTPYSHPTYGAFNLPATLREIRQRV